MTVTPRTSIVVPLHGRHPPGRDRHSAILRFSETYANVERSGITNTNERLGADSANRVTPWGSPTSRFLRRGGVE